MRYTKSKRFTDRALGIFVYIRNSEIQIQLDLWRINYLIVFGEEK